MASTGIMAAQGSAPMQHASASLYVGDLAPDVTEALLFEIFNAVGPVASIRVCRDAVTRRSLGYAYVNFHNVSDAERALDTMNFISIRGKPCRIMWSQRDPSLRKSGLGNVFVKNLDKSIDHKTLYDTFSMFGNILSCKVAMDEKGQTRGYGFVHYALVDSAEKAIQKVNGMVIAKKTVTVAQFIPKEQRQVGPRRFTNVYIQRFPKSWSEERLTTAFSECGTIDSSFLARDSTGASKQFGFCNFPNPEEAALAVESFNGREMEGHTLYVTRAMKKEERLKFLKEKYEKIKHERQKQFAGVNLYVKYLDDKIDDERLKAEFEKFGTITSAKVMRDASGRSRGFGFVCFETTEQSTKAMAEMNSSIIEGKPLYVALAQRKEQRAATLQKEYNERNWQQDRRKQTGGPAGAGGPRSGPPGPGGRGRGMRPQMNFPPGGYQMYGQQGQFNPRQQMGYVQPQMRGQWPPQNMARTPMMPGSFPPQQRMGYPPAQGMPPSMGNMGGQQNMGPPQTRPGAQPPQRPAPRGPAGVPNQPAPPMAMPPRSLPAAARPQPPTMQPNVSQPLTSEMLNAANASQQKQMIGERIFPKIQSREPKLAGKITGMLLEMDNMELLHLLENETALMEKINEALSVLNSHQTSGATAEPAE